MIHAASFLLLRCSLSCPLCARFGTGAYVAAWVFLEGLLWSEDELLLNEGVWVWSLVVALSEVCSLWFLCFCGEVSASVLPEVVCTVMWVSLSFGGMHSLIIVSVWSTLEGVHVFEEGPSLTLGMEGGRGLRLDGWLQLPEESSSFSLVVWGAQGAVSQVTWHWWLTVSGTSCGSAALLLLEDLLLWPVGVKLI